MNYITEYYSKLESGEIVGCKRIKQQFKKLNDELINPRSGWVFDERRANMPIEFIETFCKHSIGPLLGQPFKLMLWQKARLQAVFGFVDEVTRMRRAREVVTIVARKNGKSTEKAGTGNYMLIGDGEGGAQVYSVATKKDQARIVFNEAVNMISQSPHLRKHVKKRKSDLYFAPTFSSFMPLSSDSHTLDGLNIHYCVMDELHAIIGRDLYDVLKQAVTSRDQALIDMITTAGFVRESIFDDIYKYATEVLDGIIEDDRFLAFIYEIDERDEYLNPDMWIKANPGIDVVKNRAELAANVERTKHDPNFLATVLVKDFNWKETRSGAWLPFEVINNESTYDMEFLRGSYAVGGTDLSSTTDLTCATLLIMKGGFKYVLQQYFLPSGVDIARRSREDRVPYDKWAERGLLTLCEGHKVNYSDVTAWYDRMRDEWDIYTLWQGYDPYNAQYWIDEMEGHGYTMEIVRQGALTLSQPMKEMGADLAAKRINYNNNPMLKWCLTNTVVKRDENDNIRPVKGQNQRQRIDGAVSLLIAYTVLFNRMNDYQALM